jgi:hypothetical protein
MDAIFDTTDSELNGAPFAHVVFATIADSLLEGNQAERTAMVGTRVRGF